MEESFIVTSFVVSEKERGAKNAPPPMPKYRKNTPCEIGLRNMMPTMDLTSFFFTKFNQIAISGPIIEGVVAQWCNPLTLQPEQSGGVDLRRGRAPPLERHDKGSRTRLGLSYFCDASA